MSQTNPVRPIADHNASLAGTVLNDVHSRLNPTRVRHAIQVKSRTDVVTAVSRAAREGVAVSIAGGSHAMGGQQFAEGGLHLDMSRFNRILGFDSLRGHITVEAGIQWPELIDGYMALQGEGAC